MRRSIIWHSLAIIAPVSATIAVYDAVWEGGPLSHLRQAGLNLLEAFAAVIVITFLANLVLKAWLTPQARWAVDGDELTEEDRRALVYIPVRAATWLLIVVTITTATITLLNLVFGHNPKVGVGIGAGYFLTGFTFAAIVYLQSERALRTLFTRALTTSVVPRRRSIGILPRLILAWTLGSALPLLFILAIPLRSTSGHSFSIVVPMLFVSIAGLVLGAITTLLVARSVAEPIAAVRAGMEKVRDGNLDTEVAVTTPGDLGELLAGFNEMVSGLRQRRTLEDLFGRHVGAEVARQAVQSGLELGGEVRTVTALFVDIIGSTQFAETHPPRTVVARVNDLFQVVFDVVSSSGGWINKFEGDGCLCVFGAPSELADHPARGLRAARALGLRLATLEMDVGIGVSCGEVVAGNVGSVERFEYTVIGRPINEAARLTEAAKEIPGHVLASIRALKAAGPEAEHWEPAGALTLRGLSQPLPVAVPKSVARMTSGS